MVLSTVVGGMFLFAVLAGVFRRGVSQAYWAGFAMAGIGYLVLVLWILGISENNGVGNLATTRLLKQFESLVRHEVDVPRDTTGAFEIYPGGVITAHRPSGGFGGGFGGGGGGFVGGPRIVVYVPNHDTLMLSGQLLWGLLIGYCGGLLARYFYWTREPSKSSSG